MSCFKCDERFLTHKEQNIIEVERLTSSSSTSSSSSVICFFFFCYICSCMYASFPLLLFFTLSCSALPRSRPDRSFPLPLLWRTDDVCKGWNELRVERITQRTQWMRRRDICLRGKEKVRKEAVGSDILKPELMGTDNWKIHVEINREGLIMKISWKDFFFIFIFFRKNKMLILVNNVHISIMCQLGVWYLSLSDSVKHCVQWLLKYPQTLLKKITPFTKLEIFDCF